MSLSIALLLVAVLAGIAVVARWARTDGGPRPTPMPRAEDTWCPVLPTRPYGLS